MSNIYGTNDNTFINLDVLNNLTVANDITNGGDINTTGTIFANTVQAINGNFTNLTGTIAPGQLVIKHVETTRDNSSLIVGNNLTTLANNSRGVHIGYDSLSGQSSIYGCNNSDLVGDLYLNMPTSLTGAATHVNQLKTDSITEETALSGVKIMDTITIKTNEIRNGDTMIINANGITNNRIRLQSQDSDKLIIKSTDVQALVPLNMGTNAINIQSNINMQAGSILSVGSGQGAYGSNFARILAGNNDTFHISTNTADPSGWIAGSFGAPDGTPSNRVVMGELFNGAIARPTIGGHVYSIGSGYIAWQEMDINPAGNPVHIGSVFYDSANELSVSGNVDVQNAYKVNNVEVLKEKSLLLDHTAAKPLLILQDDTSVLNNMSVIGDYANNMGIAIGINSESGTTRREIQGVKTDGINGATSLDGDLFINTMHNVHIGEPIVFTTQTKCNIEGTLSVQGDVNISGTYLVNGTPITTTTWKEIHGSRFDLAITSGTYVTTNILTWNGVFSGLPYSTAMTVNGNITSGCTMQYRVTNYNQSIVFFESPAIALVSGIQRIFTSNVITPITGATATTPLMFQVKRTAGTDSFDVWSESVLMN